MGPFQKKKRFGGRRMGLPVVYGLPFHWGPSTMDRGPATATPPGIWITKSTMEDKP